MKGNMNEPLLSCFIVLPLHPSVAEQNARAALSFNFSSSSAIAKKRGGTDCWDRTDSYDDIIIEARNVDSHGHKTKKELDAGRTFVVFCFFQHITEIGIQVSITRAKLTCQILSSRHCERTNRQLQSCPLRVSWATSRPRPRRSRESRVNPSASIAQLTIPNQQGRL